MYDIVPESHTKIQCNSVDAENDKNRTNLKWQLTIATVQSPESTVTVNMSSPRLDSFVGTKHKYLATDGTDDITIKGEHLGATGSIVNNAKYESESSIFGDGNDNSPYTPTCEVLNNTFLQCKMVPGIGAFFKWSLDIMDQIAEEFSNYETAWVVKYGIYGGRIYNSKSL